MNEPVSSRTPPCATTATLRAEQDVKAIRSGMDRPRSFPNSASTAVPASASAPEGQRRAGLQADS